MYYIDYRRTGRESSPNLGGGMGKGRLPGEVTFQVECLRVNRNYLGDWNRKCSEQKQKHVLRPGDPRKVLEDVSVAAADNAGGMRRVLGAWGLW